LNINSKNLLISFSEHDDKNWMIVVRLFDTVSRLEVWVVSREWNLPYRMRINIGNKFSRWSLLITLFVSSKLNTTISWQLNNFNYNCLIYSQIERNRWIRHLFFSISFLSWLNLINKSICQYTYQFLNFNFLYSLQSIMIRIKSIL
jgi:hypothetical protein